MTDLSSEELIRLVLTLGFGLVISRAVVRLFRGRLLIAVVTMGFWMVALAALLVGYSYRDELGGVAQRVIATVVPGVPIASAPGQVTIMRARDGQFAVNAQAGKTRLTLVFDTGASAVVLRAEDAARLGIDSRKLTFDVPVGTANGRAMTAEAELPELAIGSLVERKVPVLVARPGALHENLLGMTFLDRLGSYAVTRDRLILQAR